MPVPTPVSTSWSQRERGRDGGREGGSGSSGVPDTQPRRGIAEMRWGSEMELWPLHLSSSRLSLVSPGIQRGRMAKVSWTFMSSPRPPLPPKKCQKDRRSLDEAWLTSWQAESWSMTSKQYVVRHSRWSHPSRETSINVLMRNNPCYRYNTWMEFLCFKHYCASSPVPVNHTQSAVSSHPQ